MPQILTTGRLRNEFSRIRESTAIYVEIDGVLLRLTDFRIEIPKTTRGGGERQVVFMAEKIPTEVPAGIIDFKNDVAEPEAPPVVEAVEPEAIIEEQEAETPKPSKKATK